MFLLNKHPDHRSPLMISDAETLSLEAARQVERYLDHRAGHKETPLISLAGLAREIGVGSIHLKDEGQRLGLGSFKALGGSYAVIRLVLEEATRQLGRIVGVSELWTAEVKAVAAGMTFLVPPTATMEDPLPAVPRLLEQNAPSLFIRASAASASLRLPALARRRSRSKAITMIRLRRHPALPLNTAGSRYLTPPGRATSVSRDWSCKGTPPF